jgi:WD40 repeat protein
MLAFRAPARALLPEEIAAVTSTPSLRLLAILGTYDMRQPRAGMTAFSRDGRSVLSVGSAGDLTIWDAVARTEKVRALACPAAPGEPTAIAVSADGRFVAHGNYGGRVCIRAVSDGAVIRAWEAHTAPILELAATTDGELVSYGYQERSYDETSTGLHLRHKESGGEARRWRFADGAALGEVQVGPATAVAVSADGSRLVALGPNGLLRAWDAAGQAVWTRQRPISGSFSLGASDRRLIVVEEDRILLIDPRDGTDVGEVGHLNPKPARDPIRPWKRAPVWSACLLVTPAGFAITAQEDSKTLSVWDVAGGREVGQVPANGLECLRAPSFSPDGTVMATAVGDHVVLWDARPPGQLFDGPVVSVAISADRGRAVVLTGDGRLHAWDLAAGREVSRWSSSAARSVQVSADGRRMLLKLADGRAGVADVATGAKLWSSDAKGAEGSAARLSPDGTKVAVRTVDELSLYDTRGGKRLWSFARPNRRYAGPVAFSPDGRLLMEGESGVVLARAVEDGRVLRQLNGAIETLGVAEVTGDGRHLLAQAGPGIDVFDLGSGKLLRRTSPTEPDQMEATPAGVAILRPDPNGQALRFDRAADGFEIGHLTLGKLFGTASAVAVSADGSRLLIGTDRGVVLVFAVAENAVR